MSPEILGHLAPLAILGLWSLLLTGLARWRAALWPGLHRAIGLVGAGLAGLAALALLGDPALDSGLLLLDGGLVVDHLAALADLVVVAALIFALALDRAASPAAVASATVLGAGLLLTIHAGDLLALLAGLEIAALALTLLVARGRGDRPAALRWLIGQGVLSAILFFGVALLVAATGTTSLMELGGRAAVIFTRWGAGPAQVAVDLLDGQMAIPAALEAEARVRAVGAMAPVALFIPGMLMTFAGLVLRLGAAPGHRLLLAAHDRGSPAALCLVEGGLRIAALVGLVRLFVTDLHVPRQLFAPFGWSTAAALVIAASLSVGAALALRARELRRWLAGQALVGVGWLLLGLLAAANFYAHAGLRAGAVMILDHHAWGLASGDAAIAAVLGLALAQAIAGVGLVALLVAAGDPRERGPLALQGLVGRRPALGIAAAGLLLAIAGAPPMALFGARFELLRAVIGDSNVVVQVLAVAALIAALGVAVGALRLLLAIFERPAGAGAAAPPRGALVLVLVAALGLCVGGLAPGVRGAIELAAAATGSHPGQSARGERVRARREGRVESQEVVIGEAGPISPSETLAPAVDGAAAPPEK